MKRAVIFINGELGDVSRLRLKKSDLLIGADGGTKHILKLGLKPNIIIGDLDSIKAVPKDTPVIQFPVDKDKTDTELALEYVVKLGYKEVVLIGFLGRRLDHMVSNLMLLASMPIKITIIEGNQEMFFCRDKLNISGKKNDLVSLIPLLGDCQGVTTVGLKWSLQVWNLQVSSSRGVSNVMLGKSARVGLKTGCLLVIHTYRDQPWRSWIFNPMYLVLW